MALLTCNMTMLLCAVVSVACFQFPFSTLMVVNEYHTGVPVTLFVHSGKSEVVFTAGLAAFKASMRAAAGRVTLSGGLDASL